jgi:hypothetical protein
MRRLRPASRRPGDRREAKIADAPLLIVAPQTGDTIQRRHEIREALHDEKARTIRSPRRMP